MEKLRDVNINTYDPTQWTDGQGHPINAANLNKIETALASNVSNCAAVHDNVVNVNNDLNKTKENLTAVDKKVDDLTLKTFLDKDGDFIIDAGELKDSQ